MSARRPRVRDVALDVVWRADRGSRFVDDVLASALRRGLERTDRALVTEIVHGVMRWRGTLDVVIDGARDGGRMKPRMRWILRVALYSCLFLDTTEDRVAVSAAVDAARRSFGRGGASLANAVLRRAIADWPRETVEHADATRDIELGDGVVRRGPAGSFPAEPIANLAARGSLPPWLVTRWVERFGIDEARAIVRAQNRRPGVHVVALDGDVAGVRDRLAALGIDGVPTETGVAITRGASRLHDDDAFATSGLVVQDPAQATVVPALGVSSGDTVLEVGAAPGTKTLMLAHAVGPGGRVVALDRSQRRCASVTAALERAGLAARVDVVCLDASALLPAFDGRFSHVLVDAPCSNTGVLARRSDARWRIEPDAIDLLASRQRALLTAAAGAVAPGGRLVYATCSLEREENREVVDSVVDSSGASLRLDTDASTPPSADHDGGYWARLLSARPDRG